MRVKYSLAAASLKTVNFTVDEMKKIKSKSKMSTLCSCQVVLLLVRMWTKSLCSVVDKLKLFQKQECTTINKQEDYMANYKQQDDEMAIYSWQLYHMVSFKLLLNSIVLYRQQVDYMAVFLANFLAQYFTFNHHQFVALRSLVISLAECKHFQGSWSAPRRSGKFWIMVVESKLGQKDSFNLAKDAQNLVDKRESEGRSR